MSHHWDGTESRAVGVMTDPVSGRAMSNYDIEKRFASTFGELSFEERDDALNDIHGVADPMDETPEFVSMSLENLTIELDRIESKFAYDIAKSQSVEFVANRDFLMRFLRAERFNEKQAARRMINHFQKKLELFGEGVLAKELKFSDLGHDEVAVIQSGYIRILPLRDRAGRLVLFHARSLHHHMTILTRLRIAWFFTDLASKDLTTQKKGLVALYWLLGSQHSESDLSSSHLGRNAAVSFAPCYKAYPARFSVFHLCFDDSSFRHIIHFGAIIIERTTTVRLKAHSGTVQEVLYSLMSYGIPRAILPIDHDGRVEVDDFRKWLASLQASDNVSSVTIDAMHGESLGVVVYPDEKDVLLGRGKRVEGSAGNLLLKRIIEKNSDRYEKASRFEKISVAQAVFLRMKQGGSRFLKKDGSNWIEVVDSVARDKIGHAFRNQKARSPTPHIPSATEVGDTPIPPAKRPWYHLG